ncbi:diaminopimelate epimerase [Desulfogranum japonicum]|uniref:diaminopimelate epimerase n=1 Tax=Desulfogranum japonicum TaxID=231447 RepID=UPI0003FA8432|nr:diaminopimelate epimerase [Desulfogranum japonicum]
MQLIGLSLPFMKMSGTGNDFIVVDHRRSVIPEKDMPEFARLVCRRKQSVGADGLILLEEDESVDFCWKFFNSDGSIAEMCGNGARCAARFAYMHGMASANMRFRTLAGIIEAKVADINVTVKLTAPHSLATGHQVKIGDSKYEVHSIDTGVPHAIHFVEEIHGVDVVTMGRAIRHDPLFQPAGTNANFVCAQDGKLYVRTYERGVEDETLACGTGAVASAVMAACLDRLTPPIEVVTSGGETLHIDFTLSGDTVENVYLKGPAHIIFKGELGAEALL